MITDYATLQAEIARWLYRTDLSAVIPSFISLAESRFNRVLRTSRQETLFPSVALVDGAAPLPADFAEFKALWVDGDAAKKLTLATSEFVRSQPTRASAPNYYAIEGNNVIAWPTSGSIKGTYYAKVPALSDTNTTNWLLTDAPDLYLVACLAYGYVHLKNEGRAQAYREEADRIRNEITSASKAATIGGGPLSVRVR